MQAHVHHDKHRGNGNCTRSRLICSLHDAHVVFESPAQGMTPFCVFKLLFLARTRTGTTTSSHGQSDSPRQNMPLSQYRNNLSLASVTTQSNPSVRFSPVMALHLNIVHLCVLISSRLRP
ncbi:hypothetical protein ABW19_dt0206652 [Dactylella cylindrospora]|nr:hypothetical protein ABW19_dt0206652 [Dactylella cylindrospora]